MMNNKLINIFAILFIVIVLFFILTNKSSDNIHAEDLNKDRIWDDLEKVVTKYGKSDEQKAAIRGKLIEYQKILLDPNRGILYKNDNTSYFDKPSACLAKVYGYEEYSQLYKDIRTEVINSKARLKAWIKFNKNLSGGFYTLWNEKVDGNSCL